VERRAWPFPPRRRTGDLPVNLGVRPEDLVASDDADYLYRGKVEITEALGELTVLYFARDAAGAQVLAKLPGIHSDMRGKAVSLKADPDRLHLFHQGRSLLYRS